MREYRYKKIDAFTSGTSTGNPAACLYIGSGQVLSADDMLAVARQHKGFVSEVVYCEPSEAADVKLTYYSSECEVDFCGHGTIACLYDLAKDDPLLAAKPEITVETNKKGVLTVTNMIAEQDAVFITAPEAVYTGTALSAKQIASALGIDTSRLSDETPIDVINAGLATLIVPITKLHDEVSLFPDEAGLKVFCESNDIDIILIFSIETANPGSHAHTRVFAPPLRLSGRPGHRFGQQRFRLLHAQIWSVEWQPDPHRTGRRGPRFQHRPADRAGWAGALWRQRHITHQRRILSVMETKMSNTYITLTEENVDSEHLCCAIADKKHQAGVAAKKSWLKEQMSEGHVFRKLDAKGKVFIEYAPLEHAWASAESENYIYIHCLWVSGSFAGKGYGRELLEDCISHARAQGKSGLCVLSANKKTPFLSDKKFFQRFGFIVADTIGGYELLALPFNGALPHFTDNARRQHTELLGLVIYHNPQCPYAADCIEQIAHYCEENSFPFRSIPVDSVEAAKAVPGVFNNWAVFLDGSFQTTHLLNANMLKKLLSEQDTPKAVPQKP